MESITINIPKHFHMKSKFIEELVMKSFCIRCVCELIQEDGESNYWECQSTKDCCKRLCEECFYILKDENEEIEETGYVCEECKEHMYEYTKEKLQTQGYIGDPEHYVQDRIN